ncbi:MAG: hypothetical protein P1U85_04580 [Verrucomicrobiales bacterium]|jgi:hypothetical protein|nr:hypothetical protein [Verrucomicrobiales bacterium]
MNLFFAITAGAAILGLTFLFCLLGRRHPAVLIITGVLFLCLALFTIFGFLASGELSPQEALPWRIGYGTFFCLFLGSAIALFRGARKALVK